MSSGTHDWSLNVWRWSLACFILAASTGVFMRFGLVHGFPFGLEFTNVRHAHSHLMFFGWGTPMLMLLLLRSTGDTGSRAARILLAYTFAAALASFVPFLLSGYGMLNVFGKLLPLAMMTAGLSGIAWLGFMLLYWRRSPGTAPGAGTPFFRAAILMLLAASAGVSLLAVVGMNGADPVRINALAMFFVESFSEGWFGMALLGVAFMLIPGVRAGRVTLTGLWLLTTGLLARCVAEALVKTGLAPLDWLVSLGSVAAGIGLLLTLFAPWRVLARQAPSAWHLSLGLLAAKGVFDVLLAVPRLTELSDAAGLHVFYLHAFLLGAFSIGLIAAARSLWGQRAFPAPRLFSAAVLLMLAALIPISGAWPRAWSGGWAPHLAAWTSLGPVLAALPALFTQRTKAQVTPQ